MVVRAAVLIAATAKWIEPQWVPVLNNPELELTLVLFITETWQWVETYLKKRNEKNSPQSTISVDKSEK